MYHEIALESLLVKIEVHTTLLTAWHVYCGYK
jgi:hypothetical protein